MTKCWLAGVPLGWQEPCVSFSVDRRGIPALGLGYAEAETLVTAAFALWPNAECADGFPSIAVMSAGAVACDVVEYNHEGPNSNAVLFYTTRWPHSPVALAVTTVSFNAETGRIVDADIEVNFENTALDYFGAEYVVAHEAGHFLGIDHSALDTALMFERSSSSGFTDPPTLTLDDVSAICAAYPTSRPVSATCDFEPEHGYSPICGGDIKGSCSISGSSRSRNLIEPIALFALLALFLRRSRRARA
jgi:MYXO-CTERM domain-containing protein